MYGFVLEKKNQRYVAHSCRGLQNFITLLLFFEFFLVFFDLSA